MKQLFYLTFIFNFICTIGNSQSNFKPSFSVGFDSSYGERLLKQCSRATPKKVSGFWTVSQNDIDGLESNFSNIDTLTAKNCCIVGMKSPDLTNFGFQYVGVIINRQKFIYVNAFPLSEIELFKKSQPNFDPTKSPIMVCDGGKYFWGVLYNVETKEFSELSFNGVA